MSTTCTTEVLRLSLENVRTKRLQGMPNKRSGIRTRCSSQAQSLYCVDCFTGTVGPFFAFSHSLIPCFVILEGVSFDWRIWRFTDSAPNLRGVWFPLPDVPPFSFLLFFLIFPFCVFLLGDDDQDTASNFVGK